MEIINEKIYNLAFAQTELPFVGSGGFETVEDNQTGVNLAVYESEFGPEKDENGNYIHKKIDLCDGTPLDSGLLTFPKPLPKSTPFEVRFSIDSEGILEVYAYEPKTKSETCFHIKIKGVLSPEELQETIKTFGIKEIE
jgi:molecular chaperone DnaK (HSP70)